MIAGISVKFNENTSRVHHIPGSGPQGTLLGVYWSTSHSATTMLTVLMKPSGLNMNWYLCLSSYNVKNHVPCNIGVDPHRKPTQTYIYSISQ